MVVLTTAGNHPCRKIENLFEAIEVLLRTVTVHWQLPYTGKTECAFRGAVALLVPVLRAKLLKNVAIGKI